MRLGSRRWHRWTFRTVDERSGLLGDEKTWVHLVQPPWSPIRPLVIIDAVNVGAAWPNIPCAAPWAFLNDSRKKRERLVGGHPRSERVGLGSGIRWSRLVITYVAHRSPDEGRPMTASTLCAKRNLARSHFISSYR